MPDDRLPISDLDEALELSDAAQFPYTQNNGGTLTTYKALLTQIAAKIVEDMTFAGITLPVSAGVKSVENTLNYLLDSVGGDPNGNISDSYDPTTAYVKGDLCIYENALYICTAPTTGTFDPTKWTATTIDNVIGSLSQLTTSVTSSLVGAVNEIASYTPVYGNTASGAIATFDTSLALPLQDCTIAINAVQEAGTPTPSSPKAISGFTGANIKVAGNLLNGNKVQVGDRTVRLGELAVNTYSTHLLATTYTISFTRPTNKAFRFDLIDSNNTVRTLIPFSSTNNSVTFNMTTEGDYCFSIYLYNGVSPSDIDNVMLVGGSSVAPYTPYTTPTTTPITWQDEAGTVYGGSLDVTTGVLTVTHKIIDMGSLTWNTVGMGGGRTGFKSTISDIELAPSATVVFNGKCECYASLNENDVYLGNTGIATWGANTHDIAVYDPDRESLSGADFKTAVTGSDLVYTLQTPLTYQLTPTQISAIVGTNNVFGDTNGNTSVVYACSLKDYIDSQ